MSWFLALLGKSPSCIQSAKPSRLHPPPLLCVASETLYVAAGGIPQTCLHGSFPQTAEGQFTHWLVVGLGIKRRISGCSFITSAEWGRILSQTKPNLSELDGHFAIVRWRDGFMECLTDQLGMRTLHIASVAEGIAVSTRLDWISRLMRNFEIDFEQFGSHWLTFNQFSYRSLLKGVDRLGPSGHASIEPGNYSISHKEWSSEFESGSEEELLTVLRSLINPETNDSRSLTVGLSGGLDSRLVVALLLARERPFSLHLFGHPDEPDVRIARRIATEERLMQRYYDEPLPPPDQLLSQLENFVAQNGTGSAASGFLKQRYYGRMHAEQKILIDGGMAEIARRRYMNRLFMLGRHALRGGRRSSLFPYVSVDRAPIFNNETADAMRRGSEMQLDAVLRDKWVPDEMSLENFLDLLVVRYRFPNYAGYGQQFMDGEIVNYMPFAQPSFVRAALATPVHLKKNGKLFRRLIRRYHPTLARFPLVKGYQTYPFAFPPLPAWAWTKAASLLHVRFVNPGPQQILLTLSEFVKDSVRSSAVRNFGPYDHPAILTMVNEFYEGKIEHARRLDWWLHFELWRRSLQGE